MAGSDQFLKFTDKDGDLLYVKNDLLAIFTKAERTTVGSMLEPVVRTVKTDESREIVSATTGQWSVSNSYEEILAEVDRVSACESPE